MNWISSVLSVLIGCSTLANQLEWCKQAERNFTLNLFDKRGMELILSKWFMLNQRTLTTWEGSLYGCGQSYKASTIVIYYSRVVPDLKIPHITTLDS